MFSCEANFSSFEISDVDLAKTTTSGVSAANHLSPACAASVSGSSATMFSPNKYRSSSASDITQRFGNDANVPFASKVVRLSDRSLVYFRPVRRILLPLPASQIVTKLRTQLPRRLRE